MRTCLTEASRGNYDVFETILTPSYVVHPEEARGAAGLQEMVDEYRAALSDLRVDIEQRFSAGDRVATVSTVRGIHAGKVIGTAPTGREVAFAKLVIGADDITLDLNGHTIDGDGIDDGQELGIDNTAGHDGITIEGGSIREFLEGVLIAGASKNRVRHLSTSHQAHGGITVEDSANTVIVENSSVRDGLGIIVGGGEKLRVERNSVSDADFAGVFKVDSSRILMARNSVTRAALAGMVLIESDENRIERNSISGSSEGIFLEGESDHNVMSRNSIYGNAEGVVLDPGTHHNLVTKNSLRDNHANGVVLIGSNDNVISQNTVLSNDEGPTEGDRDSDAGLHLFTPPDEPGLTSDRNTISKNKLHGNAPDGILIDPGAGENVIEANRSTANADDGIDVDAVRTTIARNTANGNHDLGIEAVPGVLDGGGNKASGNGNPLQCTNIFCQMMGRPFDPFRGAA